MPEVFAQAYTLHQLTPYSAADAFSEALEQWLRPRWPSEMPWFSLREPKALRTTDGSIFRWEPYADGTRELLEFTWRHPDASVTTVQWFTRVSFAVLSDRIHVSIRVANTGPSLGESGALLTTRPRLILNLLDHFALEAAGAPVQLEPVVLTEDDFQSFVRYYLFDPDREYPIALLSPQENNAYVVPPTTFGREFVGLARTYRAESASSTFILTEELGRRDLSCFHGAMRLYMPGLSRFSEPRHHPLVLPRRLAMPTERMRLAQVLAARAAEQFEEQTFISQLRDERAVAMDDRRSDLLASLENTRRRAADSDDFRELADAYSMQNQQLEHELEQVRDDLDEARQKIFALQHALAQRDAVAPGMLTTSVLPPADVVDAVEQAQALFPEDLLVLDSAVDSAGDSPYRDPEEVAATLAAIAEVARRLRAGPLGRPIREVFAEMKIDYSGNLSPTTPKRLRKQYRFTDGSREYVCEEHIRLGGGSYDPVDSLRIYLNSKDRPSGRIVIGHVGRHLDVLSTT